jgi:hypothetical protein
MDGKILYSSIMGMFIDESQRGNGLARLFLGIWLTICLRSNALPRSEKINKPLLSLAMSNFGFHPVCDGAIEAEISPVQHIQETTCAIGPIADLGWEPKFALYTKHPMNFGERELRIQKMIVTRVPPKPRGKVISVKTCFEHPMTQNAQNGNDFTTERLELVKIVESLFGQSVISKEVLEGTNECEGIHFSINDELLKRVIFGYLYKT